MGPTVAKLSVQGPVKVKGEKTQGESIGKRHAAKAIRVCLRMRDPAVHVHAQ